MTSLEIELIAEVERLQNELESVLTMLETQQQYNSKLLNELESLESKYKSLKTIYERNLDELENLENKK